MCSGSTYPMELLGMLYDLTGSEKSKMAASKTGCTYISACRQDRIDISTAISTFIGSNYSMGLLGMLYNLTGSENFKMASFKPEVPISHLVDKIGTAITVFSRSSYPMGLSRLL